MPFSARISWGRASCCGKFKPQTLSLFLVDVVVPRLWSGVACAWAQGLSILSLHYALGRGSANFSCKEL